MSILLKLLSGFIYGGHATVLMFSRLKYNKKINKLDLTCYNQMHKRTKLFDLSKLSYMKHFI